MSLSSRLASSTLAPTRRPAAACPALAFQQRQQQQQRQQRRERGPWHPGGAGPAVRGPPAVAAIRGVESFDGTFELTEDQSRILNELLYSELFCQQVVRDCKLPEGTKVEFTGVLFQPRPWTPKETKGMPAHIEQQYYGKPDEFTFINVPPVFMFQAKIFQPPRLCAVYKRI